MAFIADVLLVAGALGAGLYCHVLSRRLRKFTDLEKGVGGAVAVLSVQADDLAKTMTKAQETATDSVNRLKEMNNRAEASARKLELLMASMHDVPQAAEGNQNTGPFFVRNGSHKKSDLEVGS